MGICLYEALTGANPFHKDSLTGSLEAIRHCDFPPLLTQRPDLGAFAPIVAKAMARNPDDRYDTCSALADALKELIARGQVPKPPKPLADYLRGLFADDIAEEERMMSQTELAEMPLMGSTETISGRIPEPPEPVSDDKTVMDNPPSAMADEPTEAQFSPSVVISSEREVSSSPFRPNSLGGRLRRLWQQAWLRWLLAGAAVLAGYQLLGYLLRPPPNPDLVQHPILPVPPGSVPHPPEPNVIIKPEPAAVPPTPADAGKPADSPNAFSGTTKPPTPPPPPPDQIEPAQEVPGRPPRHRLPPMRPRHPAKPTRPARPPEPANETPLASALLQFHVDPPMRVTLNGSPIGSALRLKASAGTFRMGAGTDPATDPFAVQLHYRIEEKEIIFAVESEPWAMVLGAGGIP